MNGLRTLSPLHPIKRTQKKANPLELEEFKDIKFPPLDTTAFMSKTKYSFLKRKALCMNAKVPKAVSELKEVVQKAKALAERDREHRNRARSFSSPYRAPSPVRTANHAIKDGKLCCIAQILKSNEAATLKYEGQRGKRNGPLKKICATFNKQLYNSDRELEKSQIGFFRNICEKDISVGRTTASQWGNTKHAEDAEGVVRKKSVFGRIIKRPRPPPGPPKYSRESLVRLAMSDLRIYEESAEDFANNYAVNMVASLLLQTDKGAKYRKPVSFLDDRGEFGEYS